MSLRYRLTFPHTLLALTLVIGPGARADSSCTIPGFDKTIARLERASLRARNAILALEGEDGHSGEIGFMRDLRDQQGDLAQTNLTAVATGAAVLSCGVLSLSALGLGTADASLVVLGGAAGGGIGATAGDGLLTLGTIVLYAGDWQKVPTPATADHQPMSTRDSAIQALDQAIALKLESFTQAQMEIDQREADSTDTGTFWRVVSLGYADVGMANEHVHAALDRLKTFKAELRYAESQKEDVEYLCAALQSGDRVRAARGEPSSASQTTGDKPDPRSSLTEPPLGSEGAQDPR